MFLVLDFTQSLSFALAGNNSFITKALKTKKNISEILIFEIEKFLIKTNTNIKEINSIYVITGPGSFTGVRSALTFAKSLSLTFNLNIFGISKFEIMNHKSKIKQLNKCILLHFKDNQFFVQTFEKNKPINDPRLVNFDNEKLGYNSQTVYIYENSVLEQALGEKIFNKMKENFCLVEYNLDEMQEMIANNIINNIDPKPLYISNYY